MNKRKVIRLFLTTIVLSNIFKSLILNEIYIFRSDYDFINLQNLEF